MSKVFKKKTVVTLSGRTVKVARKNASEDSLFMANAITEEERDEDRLAVGATRAAIKKAIVCNVPIARYDVEKRKAFLEYADGHREYAE